MVSFEKTKWTKISTRLCLYHEVNNVIIDISETP